MATELAKAYVQIIPSAKGIQGNLAKAMDGEAASAGASSGMSFTDTFKKAVAAAGIGPVSYTHLDVYKRQGL